MGGNSDSDKCEEGRVYSVTEGEEEDNYRDVDVEEDENVSNDNHWRKQNDYSHACADENDSF